MDKYFKKHYFPITLIIILAAFLRFYKLGQLSFWYDEACSISFACRSLLGVWRDHYMLRPLYFILLNIWTKVFGVSEVISRLPSVIFGVLSVLLIYKLGKLIFNHKVGLISSFLLAISYFHIAWSQQVRNYSFLVFLCIISSLGYILAIKRGRTSNFCIYFISTVLAILTNAAAIILFLFQIIFFYKFINTNKIRWIITFSLISIPVSMTTLLLYFFRDYVVEDMLAAKSVGANIPGIWELFNVFTSGGGYIAQGATSNQIGPPLYFLSIAIGVLFIFFYIYGVFTRFRNNGQEIVYCFGWFWGSVITLISLQLLGFNCFSPKYMIFALPAYYLVIARGLSLLSSKVVLLIVFIIIILSSFFHLNFYYNPPDYSSWREVAVYIKKYIKDSDRIIIIPLQQITPFWLYYKKDLNDFSFIGNGANGRGRLVNGEWRNEFYDGGNFITGITFNGVGTFIEKDVERRFDLWVVASKDWPGLKNYSLFEEYLEKNYIFIEKKEFNFEGIEVLRYKSAKK